MNVVASFAVVFTDGTFSVEPATSSASVTAFAAASTYHKLPLP
ncbi:hypothetical protein [Thermomonas brevis]